MFLAKKSYPDSATLPVWLSLVMALHGAVILWLQQPVPERFTALKPMQVTLLPIAKPPVVEPPKPTPTTKPVVTPKPKPLPVKIKPTPPPKPPPVKKLLPPKPKPIPMLKAKPATLAPVAKPASVKLKPVNEPIAAATRSIAAPVAKVTKPAVITTPNKANTATSFSAPVANTHATRTLSNGSAQAGSGTDKGQSTGSGGNSDAVAIARVAPKYPQRARDRHIEGTVVVSFIINTQGDVVRPQVVSATPEGIFDDAALQTIERWRFKPRMVNGRAVEQRATQTLQFKLTR